MDDLGLEDATSNSCRPSVVGLDHLGSRAALREQHLEDRAKAANGPLLIDGGRVLAIQATGPFIALAEVRRLLFAPIHPRRTGIPAICRKAAAVYQTGSAFGFGPYSLLPSWLSCTAK